ERKAGRQPYCGPQNHESRNRPRREKVGAPRLELGTSALSGLRSNQLSYAPERRKTAWGGLNSTALPQPIAGVASKFLILGSLSPLSKGGGTWVRLLDCGKFLGSLFLGWGPEVVKLPGLQGCSQS